MENVHENKVEDKIYKQRWIILFTVVLLTFMSTLDSSIVNVALPVMAKKLSVSMASIEWVVTSYLIIIVGTILVFGRLGDIKGKIFIFKIGISIFTIGSLLCGISNSLEFLVFARVIQAIGAAAAMANNQGIITQVFPGHERGRALGLIGTFVALGSMVGPPIGGFIVSVLSWKYIFLVNVPVGIFTFILGMKTLPKTTKKSDDKLDVLGAFLFGATMVLMFSALTFGKETGYNNIYVISAFIIAVVLFILFIVIEKKSKEPLLKLDIFKNSLFSLSIFCAFISFITISCLNIILPFYLEDVLKLNPSITGLIMMISPIILSVVAPISGYLSDKIGSEILTFIGLLGTGLGLGLIATLTEYSPVGILILFIGILTVGNGLFQSPNNSLIMSTVDKKNLGIAGSINGLVRNLGLVVGISLSTAILYNRMSKQMGYHVTGYINGRDDVFMYGMRTVFIVATIICAVGAILTAYRLYGLKKSK